MKNKKLSTRYFIISFLITFCLVTLFSFLSLISNDSKQTDLPLSDEKKQYIPSSSHDMTVLLIGEGENRAYCLVKLSSQDRCIYAVSLPGEMPLKDRTLTQTQSYLGAQFLKDALSEKLEITVERYVRVEEKMFVKILDTLGALKLKTNEDVYSFENSFSLSKGEHILPFEKVIGVMKYNTENGEEYRLNLQTQLICEIFNQKINAEKIPVASDFFNMAINLVDTDISAFDFDLRLDFVNEFLKNPKAEALEIEFDENYNLSDSAKTLVKTHFGT